MKASSAQITGTRDQVFQWVHAYLDYTDTCAVMADADHSSGTVRMDAPDAPMRKGSVHVRNDGGTYTATFTPEEGTDTMELTEMTASHPLDPHGCGGEFCPDGSCGQCQLSQGIPTDESASGSRQDAGNPRVTMRLTHHEFVTFVMNHSAHFTRGPGLRIAGELVEAPQSKITCHRHGDTCTAEYDPTGWFWVITRAYASQDEAWKDTVKS